MAQNAPAQLSWKALEAELCESGVGKELPDGAAKLTAREFAFVTKLLQHGQMARAAKEAGYAEESAAQIAAETLKKPKVHAFYRRCLSKVANNAEALVMRAYERSALWHAKCLECAQEAKELREVTRRDLQNNPDAINDLVLIGKKDSGKGPTIEYETRREQILKREKHYAALAHQADTLLATLLGKLNINISGEVNVNHAVLTDALITARRRVMAEPGAVRSQALSGGRN
jgi:phage terminase small subunit